MNANSVRFAWRSYALGLFILFQLIYLPAANFVKLIALRLPESKGELDDDIQLRGQAFVEPVQSLADAVGAAFVRWGELSGQAQGWALFAPIFGHRASLPMVTFNSGLKPFERVRSEFLPATPELYFRLPSSSCRLFNYEYRLVLLYWTLDPSSYREKEADWTRAARARVRRQHRSMLAYMQWRTNQYIRVTGRPSPMIVSLWAAAEWPGSELPLAAWSPKETPPPGMLSLRVPDRNVGRVWLPIEDVP